MKVKVEYLGPFAMLVSKKSEVLILKKECNLMTVLKELGNRYYRLRREIFNKEGDVKPFVMLIVNNRLVRDLDKKICDGDSLCIAYPEAGG